MLDRRKTGLLHSGTVEQWLWRGACREGHLLHMRPVSTTSHPVSSIAACCLERLLHLYVICEIYNCLNIEKQLQNDLHDVLTWRLIVLIACSASRMEVQCQPPTPLSRFLILQQPFPGVGSLTICEIEAFEGRSKFSFPLNNNESKRLLHFQFFSLFKFPHRSSKREVKLAEVPRLLPAGLPAGHFQAREECRGVHIDVSALPGLLVRQFLFSWTLRSQRKRLPELRAARCLVGLVCCLLTAFQIAGASLMKGDATLLALHRCYYFNQFLRSYSGLKNCWKIILLRQLNIFG